MTTALVTGGTGFVGSHLVETLLEKGISVRCLVRSKKNLRWLEFLAARVEIFEGDFQDETSLGRAVTGADLIFHSAGLIKSANPKNFYAVNTEGTRALIRACQGKPISRWVLISSMAAAGPAQNGRSLTEETPPSPINHYGKSKRLGEELALSSGLPVCVIRPSAIYGPRDKGVYEFFKMVKWGVVPQIGKARRLFSLVHVMDVVRAAILASEKKEAVGKIYFVSDGETHTLLEVCVEIEKALGHRAREIRIPEAVVWALAFAEECLSRLLGIDLPLNRDRLRMLLAENWVCSIERMKSDLGFSPAYSVARGVSETTKWYQEQGWL